VLLRNIVFSCTTSKTQSEAELIDLPFVFEFSEELLAEIRADDGVEA
jgi:hypothetical protein